jgi:hypothetical protein
MGVGGEGLSKKFEEKSEGVSEEATVWSPLPSRVPGELGSQELALSCPCNHVLYEGTRGPGKTDAQVMKFRANVGQGYGSFWRGIIFDRQYKNLDDLVSKTLRWFPKFGDGAKFLFSGKDYKWQWPSGEELLFRVFKKESDYWSYHGHEYPFIGWNELTKYADSRCYDIMMSCNRTSFTPEKDSPDKEHQLPPIPLQVFSTTNPFGVGHNWVKARFIDGADPGEVQRKTVNVFNPRSQRREDIVVTTVRIFGSYKENIFLPPEYIAQLENIAESNRRRAWLHGDWDIVAGGAIDDLWDANVHVVDRFKVPENWYVDRSFDWGSSAPFSVGWWAEANGEEVTMPDGSTFCPAKGSLIRIAEWYGEEGENQNRGLKMGSAAVAVGIKAREAMLVREGWIANTPSPGPADNAIYASDDPATQTVADVMSDNGVSWVRSDKSAGSRKNGLQQLRDRLEAALLSAKGDDAMRDSAGRAMLYGGISPEAAHEKKNLQSLRQQPAIYFMRNCKIAISKLPTLPRDEDDPDDVDTNAEDHFYDDIRYRCLHSKILERNIKIEFPT